ncbi:MAG TPA: FtsX-like permease family protein, partial [Gemmatimonadaceae bacterium]|nr:FtsX-like permease family protein [Gemmatimonadaceae bacterium]
MLAALLLAAFAQSIDSTPARHPPRSIAIDERLAADARIKLGDRLVIATTPGGFGDSVIVSAIVRRRADPSEVARAEYRVLMHLDELQSLTGYGDRVDRFAVATRGAAATDSAIRHINDAAFGFQAYRSRDIAVETSRTFLVVSRFHRAIGVITIVASAIFLLCIMLLKVDERRRDVAALRLLGISARSIVRSVMVEAALVAVVGSGVGVALGWVAAQLINWHYRGVYRTPLAFALVTPGIVVLAVTLSLVLGLAAGLLAAQRLVRMPALELL